MKTVFKVLVPSAAVAAVSVGLADYALPTCGEYSYDLGQLLAAVAGLLGLVPHG